MTVNITYLTHIYSPRRQTLKYAYTAATAAPTSATPTYSFFTYSFFTYSFFTLLLLAASLTLSSSSDLATFSTSDPSFAAFSPSSCFTVPFDSGPASAPCLRSDSLRQLICPPSASRCICALRFAADMDVRAYLLVVSRHAIGVGGVVAYTKRRVAMQNAARGVAIVWRVESVGAYACLKSPKRVIAYPSIDIVFTSSHICGDDRSCVDKAEGFTAGCCFAMGATPKYQASFPRSRQSGFGILDDNRIITDQRAGAVGM
jgi:hypothetical protein